MFAQQDLVSLRWWKTNRAKQSLAKLEWDAKHNRGDIWTNVWGWNPLPLLTVLNNRETIIIIIIIIIIMLCVYYYDDWDGMELDIHHSRGQCGTESQDRGHRE